MWVQLTIQEKQQYFDAHKLAIEVYANFKQQVANNLRNIQM